MLAADDRITDTTIPAAPCIRKPQWTPTIAPTRSSRVIDGRRRNGTDHALPAGNHCARGSSA